MKISNSIDKKKKKLVNVFTDFYDSEHMQFNTKDEMKVVKYLGEEVENPSLNFTQVESILEQRIKDLRNHLYNQVKSFGNEKKYYEDIISDAYNDVDAMEKDMFFRIKGNFETIATDINEQRSLNLLYQKQITGLKKDKNETMLEINKLQNRLDQLEIYLGINIKDKRERLEKKKESERLPPINQNNFK